MVHGKLLTLKSDHLGLYLGSPAYLLLAFSASPPHSASDSLP